MTQWVWINHRALDILQSEQQSSSLPVSSVQGHTQARRAGTETLREMELREAAGKVQCVCGEWVTEWERGYSSFTLTTHPQEALQMSAGGKLSFYGRLWTLDLCNGMHRQVLLHYTSMHTQAKHTHLYLNHFPDVSRCTVRSGPTMCLILANKQISFFTHSCSVWKWSVTMSWENPHLYFLPLATWVILRGVFLFYTLTHSYLRSRGMIDFPSCVDVTAAWWCLLTAMLLWWFSLKAVVLEWKYCNP